MEFKNLRIADIESVESPEEVLNSIKKIIGIGSAELEVKLKTKTGEIRDIHVITQALSFSDRVVLHSIWRDITKRKLCEISLQESMKITEEERLKSEAIIKAIGEGITIRDTNYRLMYQNEIVTNIVGNHVGEICYKAFQGIDHVCRGCPVELSFKDGQIHTAERKVSSDKGVLYYENTASPIRDASGKIIAGIELVRDITERKKAEEQIRVLNEQLKSQIAELDAANRELEAFTYSVSHDLRAPLRAVSRFSEIVFEGYADKLDTEGRDYLTRIMNGSDRMSQLIEDLLRLSRISRKDIDRMDCDLSSLASDVVATLRDTNPARNVDTIIAEGLRALVDPSLMKIALTNLFDNAWKFTSKTENVLIEFGATVNDGQNIYFVKDNGAGFVPAYAERMFRPFERFHSEKEFQGTGIGLTIVERIVRRHEGRVWAEGEVGKGATIYFTLGKRIRTV